MRIFISMLILLAVSGCTSLIRPGSDSFYPGGVTAERFAADTQHCQIEADDYLAYDARGQEGTHYARNRAFNRIYGNCLRARGYRPRPYAKNLLPG